MKKSIIASLLIACSLFIGGNTDARAEYPYDKPINIIVPFGPGGGVDIAARILADHQRREQARRRTGHRHQ